MCLPRFFRVRFPTESGLTLFPDRHVAFFGSSRFWSFNLLIGSLLHFWVPLAFISESPEALCGPSQMWGVLCRCFSLVGWFNPGGSSLGGRKLCVRRPLKPECPRFCDVGSPWLGFRGSLRSGNPLSLSWTLRHRSCLGPSIPGRG